MKGYELKQLATSIGVQHESKEILPVALASVLTSAVTTAAERWR